MCVCVCGGGGGGGGEQVVYIVVETPALVVVRSEPHQCRCFFSITPPPSAPSCKMGTYLRVDMIVAIITF